ncbi:group II intron maturase-specific domain-containing protein [Cellulosilyticum sp. I15G10I2]|uniref:group II intron maturase-specific domain-containing protein n=1 Tax=Cellulosilyticum sp. I15G10I2 TaxID=1892843 RepID=UPI0026F45C5A
MKALEINKKTECKIEMIAECINSIIRGWINYFGKYNAVTIKYSLDCVERRIVKWAMRKFKRFRGHRRRAEIWLSEVRKRKPSLFAHCKYRNRNVVTS